MSQLRLLSKPGIFFEDAWQPLPKGKTSALLYYLAYQGDWVSRDELVYLFWPDTSETQARSNLRSLLSRSIGKLSYVNLDIERQKIRWQVDSDFASYQQSLSEGNYLQVIENYTGELLSGYSCNDAPEFEHWLELERQEVFEGFKAFAQAQVDNFMIEKNYKDLARILKAVLDHDPFDEITFRQYLKAVYLSEGINQANSALNSYEKALEKEFSTAPEPSTLQLLQDLDTAYGHVTAEKQAITAVEVSIETDKQLHNLPLKLSPFVGRNTQRTELAAKLADQRIRLITIVATGGMGKTRLALSVAEDHIGSFADGVWFIAFETLESIDNIVNHIADAIEFRFFGQETPKAQLIHYLKDKDMLLVMDNLEHLLDGTLLIPELLEQAANLKVLATSRELLDLQVEHVYDLKGLDHTKANDTQAGESEAVQLFIQSAQQRQDTLDLNSDTKSAIAMICSLVEGMPLAIELAVSWLRVLSPQEIIDELKQGIDILESQARDIPDRHQSIRHIFDYSWKLLSQQEQVALRKLAIFHGGFSRVAAKNIVGVSTPILLGLSKKSLLRREASGRFTQHPLMWQFVREQFDQHDDKESISEQHATYFADFLDSRLPEHEGLNAVAIRKEILTELANILAAWDWMINKQDKTLITKALWSLCEFYHGEHRFDEGIRLFEVAEKSLERDSLVRAQVLHRLAFLYNMVRPYESKKVIKESIRISRLNGAELEEGYALFIGSFNFDYLAELNPQEIITLLNRCVDIFRKHDDSYHEGRTLANLCISIKDANEREAMIRRAIMLFRRTDSYFGLTFALGRLVHVVTALYCDWQKAIDIIDEALSYDKKRNIPVSILWRMNEKATMLDLLGQYEEAELLLKEVQIRNQAYERYGVFINQVQPYLGLGYLAINYHKNLELAGEYLQKAMSFYQDNHNYRKIDILKFSCYLALEQKDYSQARTNNQEAFKILLEAEEPYLGWYHNHQRLLQNQSLIEFLDGNLNLAKENLKASILICQDCSFNSLYSELFVIYAKILKVESKVEDALSVLDFVLHSKCTLHHVKEEASEERSLLQHEKTLKKLSSQDIIDAILAFEKPI